MAPARIALVLTLLLAAPAGAASFTVDSTGDQPDASPGNSVCAASGGACTLRAALMEANALTGADEVTVPAGTYQISTSLPITKSVAITAPAGAGQTVVDAHGTNSFVNVNGAEIVSITGLAITGVVSSTSGAIYLQNSDLTLTGVDIRDNGTASTGNGGVIVFSGSLKVVRSAITGNRTVGTSQALGGGLRVLSGSATVESTTIAGNSATATDPAGSLAYGGGIYSNGTLTLRHVSLLDNSVVVNTSARSGGNIMSNGTTSIADSILSGGQALNGPDCSSFGGATIPAVSGKNVVGVTTGGCTFPAETVVANAPQLGALGDHGAPGKSAVPAAGSPALDAASACPDGGRDQRGAAAPSGVACDIGAAEASADLQVSVQASSATAAPGEQVSFVIKATNAGPDPAGSTSIAITPPSGAEVLLVSPSTGSCDQTTCSVGTLAAGSSATVTVVVRPSSAGTATTSATATSPIPDPTSGDATGSASTTVAAAGGGGGGGGGGTTTDTTAPVLSVLAVKGKLRSGKAGRLRAVLSEAASVRIVVARTKGKRRRVGVIVARLAAGNGVIVVPRKLKGKRLKPGLYRLTAVATDAAGNRSAPKRITVRVRTA